MSAVHVRAILIAVCFGFAGCGERPDSPGRPPSAENGGSPLPVQSAERPEITAGKISKDVVGRVVEVPELSGSGPSDKWTFEADEYRRIEILDKRATASGVELLVFMLTRSNSKPGQPDVQVAGHLRLRYEWQDKQWVLRGIENVSFRYSVGVTT